jgi:hypothetical protein
VLAKRISVVHNEKTDAKGMTYFTLKRGYLCYTA